MQNLDQESTLEHRHNGPSQIFDWYHIQNSSWIVDRSMNEVCSERDTSKDDRLFEIWNSLAKLSRMLPKILLE